MPWISKALPPCTSRLNISPNMYSAVLFYINILGLSGGVLDINHGGGAVRAAGETGWWMANIFWGMSAADGFLLYIRKSGQSVTEGGYVSRRAAEGHPRLDGDVRREIWIAETGFDKRIERASNQSESMRVQYGIGCVTTPTRGWITFGGRGPELVSKTGKKTVLG